MNLCQLRPLKVKVNPDDSRITDLLNHVEKFEELYSLLPGDSRLIHLVGKDLYHDVRDQLYEKVDSLFQNAFRRFFR